MQTARHRRRTGIADHLKPPGAKLSWQCEGELAQTGYSVVLPASPSRASGILTNRNFNVKFESGAAGNNLKPAQNKKYSDF